MAITHGQVWGALDALAARLRLSPSGLAKTAGLDPTSFNRSKRHSNDTPPRPRWPSTESLAKVLNATGVSLAEFATLAEPRTRKSPAAGFAEDWRTSDLDSGFTAIGRWDEVDLSARAGDVVGLVVTGRSGEPVLRAGDRIQAEVAGGDLSAGERAVLRTRAGQPVAGVVVRTTADSVVLRPFGGGEERVLATAEIGWRARILSVALVR